MGSCSSASQFKPCDKCMKSFSETTEEELMLRIAIIIGSTRPGRNGEAVGKWVYEIAQKRSDAEFELVDIKNFNLPLLDEPMPPIMGQYSKPHTKAWAAKIGSFDGYVFVTPEYNHGTSGALKNAIDFLFAEWNNKAAGFVSYGGASGGRAGGPLPPVLGPGEKATLWPQKFPSTFSALLKIHGLQAGPPPPQHFQSTFCQVAAPG